MSERFFTAIFLLICSACAGLAAPGMGSMKVTGEAETSFRLRLEKATGRAVVIFDYEGGALDLSKFRDIAIPIQNGTVSELDVHVHALSDRKVQWLRSTSGRFFVRPGESLEMTALMARHALPADHPYVKRLGNLYAFPWGHQRHWRAIDPSAILQIRIQIDWSDAAPGQIIAIGSPRGAGDFRTDPAALATLEMPLLDLFGQLRIGDWPGKVHDAGELRADAAIDADLVSTVTTPREGRSRYGGMTGGPDLRATGFFRVEKLDGKWWFVDPDGNLFWSLGVNCVGSATETKVTGREEIFPQEHRSAPSVSHYWDNLKVKSGEQNWRARQVDLTLARMFDWGLNTVGAWSISEMAETGRVPYTLIVHTDMQPLGRIKKIADPFSEAFQNSLDRIMPELAAKHAGTPWLLGVFVDNELDWPGGHELVSEILRCSADTPARVALVAFLQNRHGNLEGLNEAWNTSFKDVADIRPSPGPLGEKTFATDLDDFLAIFADRYFTVCRKAMKKYFPGHLYLGCRFHQFNPFITAAASRHCDVLSANIYQHSLEEFRMKTDQDRPWLISEFHFGTPDHGVWGVGLTWAANARNQADLYEAYISDALRQPNFVGAHWFAWTSQTVTGRSDGENFGIGLVTLVDRPLPTLTAAVREVSAKMYDYRLGTPVRRIGGGESSPSPR